MKSTFVFCFILLAGVALLPGSLSAQCDIPKTGQNLCNADQTSYLTNTSNSITISDIALLPVDGTYNVIISYYKQSRNACAPIINCSGATVTTSGSSVTISLGSCATLPGNFSTEGIIRVNLTDGPEGDYFIHFLGGACLLPLGYTVSGANLVTGRKVAVKVEVVKPAR
jgi:hypothetical protein